MKDSLRDFINEISSVIFEIEKEISERKNGIAGNGNVTQLEIIKEELVQLRQQAISSTLPPKDKRFTGFSRYVVDEWDVKDSLGKKLCNLADRYKRRL